MARVVIAWELGAGFGHLVPMAAIGTALRRRGHEVTMMLRPGARGAELLRAPGVAIEEQPAVPAPARTFSLSVNYSANLLRNGFWHSDTVRARVASWRDALVRQAPDLLICDHAPSALLATRGGAYPRVAIGTGFTVPPLAAPMPSLQPWFAWPEARLAEADREWLDAINEALNAGGFIPLDSVASLFEGVNRLLCVEADLDHYAARPGDQFLGTMEPPAASLAPFPSPGPGLYVFVYLSPTNRFLQPVLRGLDQLGWPVIAYVGGQGAAASLPAFKRITYLNEPADLSSLGRRCRLAITQGGTMLASFLLKRDVPLLICPEDLEKAVLGFRLSRRGLARTLNWFAPVPDDLVPTLEAISGELNRMPARKSFAQRYAGVSSEEIATRAAEYCVDLMERSA